MTLIRMILREMQRAKFNTLLCLVTVAAATGLLIAMVAVSRASVDATRILMKDMGFNLLITPAGVDPARYQALDFQDVDMPEEYVTRLARNTVLARHFVGKYQKTIQIDGVTVVLTGVLPEAAGPGHKKQPLPTAYDVPRGEAFVGAVAAKALKLADGGSLNVLGRSFRVTRVVAEAGVIPEDIRVFCHLHGAQELLDRAGRINAIDALSCQCPVDAKDMVAALRRGIQDILPDVEVKAYESILLARHKQRQIIQVLASITLAIVMAGAALAIWGLTHLNVRNRRREIGVLCALGVPVRRIATLFVGKILIFAAVGAAAGCTLGYALAAYLNLVEAPVKAPVDLIVWVVSATPLVAVLFGLGPIVGGLIQEPAESLREE